MLTFDGVASKLGLPYSFLSVGRWVDNPNYCGDDSKGHDERRAEELAKKRLLLIGLAEEELNQITNGDKRKALVALAIKDKTGASL